MTRESLYTSGAPPLTPDRVQAIGRVALEVPRLWVIGMVLAALTSAIHVTLAANGDVSGSFMPSTLTGILVALIWLPALLRVIALAGGGIKTPAGEASTGGLLSFIETLAPETKRLALPPLITALSSPEVVVDPDRRAAARPVQRDLELQLAAASIPVTPVREQIAALAREYERVRADVSPSDERTQRMTSLMAQGRAVARTAPLPFIDLRNMLTSGQDGERVLALALVQDLPDKRLIDPIIEAIRESRSAFEQYQALGAAFELVGVLEPSERRKLIGALTEASRDDTRGISEDSSRMRLVEALLDQLRAAP